MDEIRQFTTGFTKKTIEDFFTLLEDACVKRVMDARRSHVFPQAGSAMSKDPRYFLKDKPVRIETCHR